MTGSTSPKTAYILVAGRLSGVIDPTSFPAPDLVLAADGGARHAAQLGLTVDRWVGDFDSSSGNEVQAPREVHPTAKDQTDGELATQLALEAGCTRLVFVGAFGGRFDHTAALLLGAVRLAEQGLEVWLTSGDEHARPLVSGATVSLPMAPQTTFSVAAVSDLLGLSLRGARWPLTDADVPLGSGWTLSNQSAGDQVTASLREGRSLLVWQGRQP